ncbi:DEAD/DEAH box helicase family protein [Demequina lutea]|uniref:Superfamily II DNA or RNA helicase n=1 Tax=Demequina lutea TaxID=431489 RepID=A0A7Y9ZA89_9MICO|nr:DEAD/DEAH box helicase family protein [Demequina lutea]NYI40863.1 superfamily II DNA or RNA helicase [Demequina lutea]
MTDQGFLDAAFLVEVGPYGFGRQIQRALPLAGYTEVANIDGPGDAGGDLIANLNGAVWVFQAKWKKHPATATVGEDAVDEVQHALSVYGGNVGVVVTNARMSVGAKRRARTLTSLGQTIHLWDRDTLQALPGRLRLPRKFELRTYQAQAVDVLWNDLSEHKRALAYLATGLGKTVVAGSIIERFLDAKPDARIAVVAHSDDLVDQLETAMWRNLPEHVRTRKLGGGERPDSLDGVTFAVLPTAARYVENGYRPDLLIVDEAHHVGESGHYARIFDHLHDIPRLGVTATPWRGDKFDIESEFRAPGVRISISDGISNGYLSKVKYRLFSDNIDWDFVKASSEHGYAIKDLNRQLFLPQRDEEIRDRLYEVWERTTRPRGIVFCQTIEHAERMARMLRALPDWRNAEAIHAKLTKRERQQRLLRFRSGATQVLTSVDLLNEGVDVPDVNVLCFARVTHSRRIFIQQLGRGLRLQSGKSHVEVLDFVSDIRRVAAVTDLARQTIGETEVLPLDTCAEFIFEDQRITSLLDEWLADVGDLEGADDSVRLEFPPSELML